MLSDLQKRIVTSTSSDWVGVVQGEDIGPWLDMLLVMVRQFLIFLHGISSFQIQNFESAKYKYSFNSPVVTVIKKASLEICCRGRTWRRGCQESNENHIEASICQLFVLDHTTMQRFRRHYPS